MRWSLLSTATAVVLLASDAWALPVAPAAFCDAYPEAPTCLAGLPACTYCHAGTPPTRNRFGMALEAKILPAVARPLTAEQFLGALPTALMELEGEDADGDGYTNLDEILSGTLPADDLSRPDEIECAGKRGTNDQYDVCNWDARYAFKKVSLDFCGRSPTWEEMQTFEAAGDPRAAVHTRLTECLDSPFWIGQDGQLWELAHKKIRPIQAIKSGDDGGIIPLADYYDDYRLYVYAQTDDHDARSVLTADFFTVARTNADGRITHYDVATGGDRTGRQDIVPERRAGMMTTRWNLVLNVMFTALPRTAAAQAYRSFLGMDIAKLQGLQPVTDEPVDYDEKGVQADACKVCHSTLDPASYPFKNYQGLTGNVGTYDPNRIQDDFRNEGANITAMPEAGYVLGQPVANLTEWGQVAANSDAFAAASVLEYWRLLLGHDPLASEQEEFNALWTTLKGRNNYRIERMLHDLIDTEAYGVP